MRRSQPSPAGWGDLAESPSAPTPTDAWQLGPPDLIVEMTEAYRLPADGADKLRNFVIPIPISKRRYVKAWEFRTNNPRVVHHATMMLDPTRTSRQMDARDPEPGYEGVDTEKSVLVAAADVAAVDGYALGRSCRHCSRSF